MRDINYKFINICLIFICLNHYIYISEANDPVGHLKPMGSHRPAEPQFKTVEGLESPLKIYYEHLLPSKPLIMRRAVLDLWPALKKWKDDDYLKDRAGKLMFTIEKAKKENRIDPMEMATFASFLDRYQKQEFNQSLYLIGEVPESVLNDLVFPKEMKKLYVTPTRPALWMSSGGTASFLHNDDQDNINCVVDGQKEFIMIHKVYSREVYDGTNWPGYGKRAPFDVDAVDLKKFPLFKHVPWWNVTLNPGDCLFIPNKWFHQVRVPNTRSIAINMWFQPPRHSRRNPFNENYDPNDTIQLNDMKFWNWQPLDPPEPGNDDDEREAPKSRYDRDNNRNDDDDDDEEGDDDGWNDDLDV